MFVVPVQARPWAGAWGVTCESPVAALTDRQSADTQGGRGDGGLWGEELVSGLQRSPQATDPPENTSEENRSWPQLAGNLSLCAS